MKLKVGETFRFETPIDGHRSILAETNSEDERHKARELLKDLHADDLLDMLGLT